MIQAAFSTSFASARTSTNCKREFFWRHLPMSGVFKFKIIFLLPSLPQKLHEQQLFRSRCAKLCQPHLYGIVSCCNCVNAIFFQQLMMLWSQRMLSNNAITFIEPDALLGTTSNGFTLLVFYCFFFCFFFFFHLRVFFQLFSNNTFQRQGFWQQYLEWPCFVGIPQKPFISVFTVSLRT